MAGALIADLNTPYITPLTIIYPYFVLQTHNKFFDGKKGTKAPQMKDGINYYLINYYLFYLKPTTQGPPSRRPSLIFC